MGDHRAFITYNHGYGEIAEKDKRDFLLKVRVKFNNPTPSGMPTNEEFAALSSVDDKLDDALSKLGAVYVGRITVDGQRHFFFYVDTSEHALSESIEKVSIATTYKLQYSYKHDPKKEGYWNDLYPTADDWQVIQDLKVLDSLRKNGDVPTTAREVLHWAYFPEKTDADHFGEWAKANNFNLISIEPSADKKMVAVRFSHLGTMALEDITHRTIAINRKAKELHGDYDGWETSIEK